MKKVTPPIYYFVAVAGLLCAGMGLGLAIQESKFTSPAYDTLFSIIPPHFLAVYLMAIGTLMLTSYATKTYALARAGLVGFGTYLIMEAAAFFAEYLQGNAATWGFTRSLALFAFCGIGAFAQFPNVKE